MKIKDYLDKKKITQEAFAKSVGVKRVAVARWVTGGRLPRPETARKIVEVTGPRGITMKDIYG